MMRPSIYLDLLLFLVSGQIVAPLLFLVSGQIVAPLMLLHYIVLVRSSISNFLDRLITAINLGQDSSAAICLDLPGGSFHWTT